MSVASRSSREANTHYTMNLPITLLVLAAIGHAVDCRLPSTSTATNENKTNDKRELYEGNYGLRNGVSFETKYGVTPGIEYAEDPKDVLSNDPHDHIFGTRLPQIAKISDLLTGQGPPFEVALANHLYSPVSAYQARFSTPTTFDVSTPGPSRLEYAEQNNFKQNHEYVEQQYQTKPETEQHKEHERYTYKNPIPEYSRADSKLLHLETAFPGLEPIRSTPAPIFPQDILLHHRLEPIQSHLYPQYSFQQLDHIPLRFSDGSLQPVQYVQQSLLKLVPVQTNVQYTKEKENDENNDDSNGDQDDQPNENPQVIRIAPPAPIRIDNTQTQALASYANFYENQPYAPSQQYQLGRLTEQVVEDQTQNQYQLTTLPKPAPQPTQQLVQTQQQDKQQYEQQYQSQQQSSQDEILEQVVHIPQTTRQPGRQLLHLQQKPTYEQPLSTLPILETQPTLETVTTTESTLKPYSEILTTPKPFTESVQTTTFPPYTTHKPIRPLRPLSRLQPVSRPLPYPRPFSNTQPTTLAPLSPFPTFRRHPHINTPLPTTSTTYSSLPTITSTEPNLTSEILSSQPFSSTTPTVSRKPIIRIRHKSYNQFQSTTTPQPTELTTLETLVQPTTTSEPLTTLQRELQPHLQSIQTQKPENFETVGPEYLPPSELPPQSLPAAIYHLQRDSQLVSPTPQPLPQLYPKPAQNQPSPQPYERPGQIQTSPRPYLRPGQIQPSSQQYLQPGQIQPSPQPYPQPAQIQPTPPSYPPPGQLQILPQPYPQRLEIQPIPQPQVQAYLQPSYIQATPKPQSELVIQPYQPPVFNLRPQYEPQSTPLPPQATLSQAQPVSPPPRPDLQKQKQRPIKFKPKPVVKPGETYITRGSILTPVEPILQPQIYSQSHELFFQPEYPQFEPPTYPAVQYFGKYAEAIFGHIRQ